MINSMTGFGRGEAPYGDGRVVVEVTTVNGRFLETSVRGLREYGGLELAVRGIVRERLGRGTVAVTVALKGAAVARKTARADVALAQAFEREFDRTCTALGLKGRLPLEALANRPDLITIEEESADAETFAAAAKAALAAALDGVAANRRAEGERLAADVEPKLAALGRRYDDVAARAPGTVADYRERLKARVADLKVEAGLEPGRLEAEVALFADRCDISEEVARSAAHLQAFRAALAGGEPTGRRLDFLTQELNREANTMGAKAQDVAIGAAVIEIKNLLEQIREQVQNIE
jgi:uncharacterized protein (TIGR00255 family)